MPKINVYLPDDLAEKVRQQELPVSAICQRALQREVSMAEARGTKDDVALVAARLRQTRAIDEDAQYAKGYDIGTRWAREVATLAELEHLNDMHSEHWRTFALNDDHSLLDFLHEEEGWEDPSRDFTREPLSRGIVGGAVQVYGSVSNLI